MNQVRLAISALTVLIALGLPGGNWTAMAQEEAMFVRLNELKGRPVVLTDDSSSGKGYKIAGREFSSQQSLFGFLEIQPTGFFTNGILLVDEEKAANDGGILHPLSQLARQRRFNLYLRQATGKKSDEQRVRWVVRFH